MKRRTLSRAGQIPQDTALDYSRFSYPATARPKGLNLDSTPCAEPIPSFLEAALAFLRLSISVIPLRGKIPAIKWEMYQEERAGEALIREWFAGNSLNIGIVTGRVSGLVVLDVDGPEGVETLSSRDLFLPLTPTAKTGKGTHFYFKYPDGHEIRNFARKLPGLDLRGEGGYVVAPPSLHESGVRYEWEHPPDRVPLAPAPSWLLELCKRENGEGQSGGPRIDPVSILQGVPEGSRNDTLFREAARLRTLNLKREEAEILILEMARRCIPPFPEREALSVVASAYRYPPGGRILSDGEKGDSGRIVYQIRTVRDIEEYPDPSYLIDPVMPKDSILALGAWTGTAKTIISHSIERSVLTGESLWDKYPVIETGPVLLVDEETPRGWFKERVRKAGIKPDLPFFALHFEEVRIDEDRHFEALMEAIDKVKPVLLVIDPLIRVHRKKESLPEEMALVMARLRKIANNGPVVLVIHHHRKGEGPLAEKMRGSSDILGGIDIEYSVVKTKEKDVVQFASGKTRTAPLEPINLKLTFGEAENTVAFLGTEEEMILEAAKDVLQGGGRWHYNEIKTEIEKREIAFGMNSLRTILIDAAARGEIQGERESGRGKPWAFWMP